MKNFNKPNLNSQSNEDNFKNTTQENDKSIEVSNFGNKPNLELFYNGAKFGFSVKTISIRKLFLVSVLIMQ